MNATEWPHSDRADQTTLLAERSTSGGASTELIEGPRVAADRRKHVLLVPPRAGPLGDRLGMASQPAVRRDLRRPYRGLASRARPRPHQPDRDSRASPSRTPIASRRERLALRHPKYGGHQGARDADNNRLANHPRPLRSPHAS